jgi:hypothetical protein
VVVVRVGFTPNEDHILAFVGPGRRVVRRKHRLTDGGAGRSIQARRDRVLRVLQLGLDRRLEEFVQLPGRKPIADHCDIVYQTLFHHVRRDLPLGARRSLPNARLKQPQLTFLDCELDVAHVLVVLFECAHVLLEFVPSLRLHVAELFKLQGVTDACDDILPLCVRQIIAVRTLLTRSRVTSERHSRAGVASLVAEHHRLNVDRRPEVVGDLVATTVVLGALVVPRTEDRFDPLMQLLTRILRELSLRVAFDDLLERLDELLQGLYI